VEGRETRKCSPCDSRSKENIDGSQSQHNAGKPEMVKETAGGRKLYYLSVYGNQYELQRGSHSHDGSVFCKKLYDAEATVLICIKEYP
jgi:hypothetical protein